MLVDKTYADWVTLWALAYGPTHSRNHPSVMSWAKWLEDMLGPNNCKGFIIRSHDIGLKGMFLADGKFDYVPWMKEATVFTWESAAIKITINRKLEAIRVDYRGVAQDSTGLIVGILEK